MRRLVNFKIKRISEGRYCCFSTDFSDIKVEGSTEWEALTAAQKVVRQRTSTNEECVTT